MPDTLHLRTGQPGDALCISGLATQVFYDTYATDGMRADLAREAMDVYAPAQFERRLNDPSLHFMLAQRAGHLLGFAEVQSRPEPALPIVEGGMELVRLYLSRHCHRQGIGARLLAAAERHVIDSGLPFLWLRAYARNAQAKAFYLACGYEDVGQTVYRFDGNDYENRLYRRTLPR